MSSNDLSALQSEYKSWEGKHGGAPYFFQKQFPYFFRCRYYYSILFFRRHFWCAKYPKTCFLLMSSVCMLFILHFHSDSRLRCALATLTEIQGFGCSVACTISIRLFCIIPDFSAKNASKTFEKVWSRADVCKNQQVGAVQVQAEPDFGKVHTFFSGRLAPCTGRCGCGWALDIGPVLFKPHHGGTTTLVLSHLCFSG